MKDSTLLTLHYITQPLAPSRSGYGLFERPSHTLIAFVYYNELVQYIQNLSQYNFQSRRFMPQLYIYTLSSP